MIFFVVLLLLRDTQVTVLLRGVFIIIILLAILTSLIDLPAFTWLSENSLPALLLAIPVILAPEIRRGLEKVGRAGSFSSFWRPDPSRQLDILQTIHAVVLAAARLSARQHGALIILERGDHLDSFISTGVRLDAAVTAELLLQIFVPNTPLHDGAVIIADNRIAAASCVMPLSASGVLNRSVDRQMGLRHRAALGTSEASDAITVVVSEETGSISIAHNGRMIRRLDSERLENILSAFYRPEPKRKLSDRLKNWIKSLSSTKNTEE
jgi:diadenylate cyclase